MQEQSILPLTFRASADCDWTRLFLLKGSLLWFCPKFNDSIWYLRHSWMVSSIAANFSNGKFVIELVLHCKIIVFINFLTISFFVQIVANKLLFFFVCLLSVRKIYPLSNISSTTSKECRQTSKKCRQIIKRK